MNTARNQFVIDNVTDGFDLHQLDTGRYIRTLTTGPCLRTVPKQVAFAEDSTVVVGGSDQGSVFVFSRISGTPAQILRHTDRGLVQTIAVGKFLASMAQANIE